MYQELHDRHHLLGERLGLDGSVPLPQHDRNCSHISATHTQIQRNQTSSSPSVRVFSRFPPILSRSDINVKIFTLPNHAIKNKFYKHKWKLAINDNLSAEQKLASGYYSNLINHSVGSYDLCCITNIFHSLNKIFFSYDSEFSLRLKNGGHGDDDPGVNEGPGPPDPPCGVD